MRPRLAAVALALLVSVTPWMTPADATATADLGAGPVVEHQASVWTGSTMLVLRAGGAFMTSSLHRVDAAPLRANVTQLGARVWTSDGQAVAWDGSAMWIMGGLSSMNGSMVDTIARYDPVTDSYANVSHLPIALSSAGAFFDGRYVYTVGGLTPPGTLGVDRVFRYDPVTNTTANMTARIPFSNGDTGVFNAPVAWTGTRALIVGGMESTQPSHPPVAATRILAYDPAAEAFSVVGSTDMDRRQSGIAFDGNAAFVFGGRANGTAVATTSVLRVDGATGATSIAGDLPRAMLTGTAVWTGTRALAVGDAGRVFSFIGGPVPDAPVSLAAAGVSSVSLSWSAPADHGHAITSYRIYRGLNGAFPSLLTSVPSGTTSYVDASLAPTTDAVYDVTAVNDAGEGPASEVAASTDGPPSEPLSFAVTIAPTNFTLAWQPPARVGNHAVTGYRVYAGDPAGSETFLTDLPASARGYVDPATLAWRSYRVAAINSLGEGALTASAGGTNTLMPAPALISDPTGGPAPGQVHLNWSAGALGGNPLVAFNVYRAANSSGPFALMEQTTNLTHLESGQPAGKTWWFVIGTVTRRGETRTAPVSATAPTTPGPPRGLGVNITADVTSAKLSWSASVGGGAHLEYYAIFRDSAQLAVVGPTTLDYVDRDVPLASHTYTVTAVNCVGSASASIQTTGPFWLL